MSNPFFLTSAQAQLAFEAFVLASIKNAMQNPRLMRKHLYVVALEPSVPYQEHSKLPILFEYSIGNRDEWEKWDGKTFDDFARAKARISWRTGLSSREVALTKPHLLLPGDTRRWGSVVVNGLIVAVSGAPPIYNEMFATMTAAALIAEAISCADTFARAEEAPADFLNHE